MQGQSAPPPPRAGLWLTAALILGLTFACYWPALRGGMIWDDDAHVTRPELRSAAGLWQIWSRPGATQQYYPLLHSAFWIEHRLWGDATLGYHLANVLQHCAAALLLVLILRRLGAPGARLAGLLFAVHPVCVESVAWISEQKNTLSLVLYLVAGLAYLRFDSGRGKPGASRQYLLASALFVSALMTKTVTATLPAALLVVFWWQRGRLSWRRDVLPLVSWFVFAIASGLFTALVERRLIGAEGAGFDLTPVQRLLLAGHVIWFYLGKLLWPAHLVFIYPRSDVGAEAASWVACLAAAVLVTAFLWLLRRRARGPLSAWLFFVGSLFPSLGFLNVYPFIYSYVADHFQYMASMGIFAAASAGAVLLLDRAPPAARASGWGIVAALVATLCILSNAQSRTYADQRTLYAATIDGNPECWMAHNNLGLWYEGRGDLENAVSEFREAIRLRKDYAAGHNNLGSALVKLPGRLDDAVSHYEEALRLRPGFAEAHNNLGNALEGIPGRLDDAIHQFEEALRLEPDYPEAHNNLGNALEKRPGSLDDAVSQYEEALRLRPDYAEAHDNLGNVLSRVPGRADEAIAQFEEALRLRPDLAEAHNNLGSVLGRTASRRSEAISHFQEALRLRPDFAEAHNNLGTALLDTPGRLDEAASQYRAALRVRPEFAEAHNNLGNALSRTPGRLDEAISQYQEALRLKPDYAGAHNNLGTALNAEGRTAEAIAEYEAALRLMPASADIHLNIAMALLGIPGREDEAAGHLEAVLRARPGDAAARQLLERTRRNRP